MRQHGLLFEYGAPSSGSRLWRNPVNGILGRSGRKVKVPCTSMDFCLGTGCHILDHAFGVLQYIPQAKATANAVAFYNSEKRQKR